MFKKFSFILFCSVMLSFAACKNHSKFDRTDWNDGDGLTFSYRDGMVDDLVKNYKLKGLKYQEAFHLLHRPQQSSKTEMIYEILEISKPGKPYYIKQLILTLKDSVVTDAKIYENTAKK